VHPIERLRIVTATARAVLEGRLDPSEAAVALEMQREQIADRLRSDRLDVTQTEAREVATTLRRLGEQITDQARGIADPEPHLAIAEALGQLAQSLR
jgi:hypothetical protein